LFYDFVKREQVTPSHFEGLKETNTRKKDRQCTKLHGWCVNLYHFRRHKLQVASAWPTVVKANRPPANNTTVADTPTGVNTHGIIVTYTKELSYCWDGRAMLRNSNFRCRTGVPLFAVFLRNLWEYDNKS